MALYRKLTKSLQVNGPWGTMKLILRQPIMALREGRSARYRNRVQREFDEKFGTDTGGVIPLSELEITSTNWIHGGRYGPTSPERFRRCLTLLPLKESEYKNYTFIDLGSGKGATLLYACDHGFKKAIGVEFVLSLHQIAEANIAKYPTCSGKALSLLFDASEYQFPAEPIIVFASNPFSAELMNRMLCNLGKHTKEKYVLHENSHYSLNTLSCGKFLHLLKSDWACRAYSGHESISGHNSSPT